MGYNFLEVVFDVDILYTCNQTTKSAISKNSVLCDFEKFNQISVLSCYLIYTINKWVSNTRLQFIDLNFFIQYWHWYYRNTTSCFWSNPMSCSNSFIVLSVCLYLIILTIGTHVWQLINFFSEPLGFFFPLWKGNSF